MPLQLFGSATTQLQYPVLFPKRSPTPRQQPYHISFPHLSVATICQQRTIRLQISQPKASRATNNKALASGFLL